MLSIVCAVHNGASTLSDLLHSWANQASPDAELLVIDALSTDATWALVERPEGRVDAALSEADGGIYDAWNKSLAMCRGRYVSFVGCDDVLACGAVEVLVKRMRDWGDDDEDAPHLIAGFNVLTRKRLPVALVGEPYRVERLHRRIMVAHVMAAHRLNWLRGVGGFDGSYRSSGDYELLLRERARLRVDTLPRVLTYVEDGGMSRHLLLSHVENFRARVRTGVGRLRAGALFGRALAYTALRLSGLK